MGILLPNHHLVTKLGGLAVCIGCHFLERSYYLILADAKLWDRPDVDVVRVDAVAASFRSGINTLRHEIEEWLISKVRVALTVLVLRAVVGVTIPHAIPEVEVWVLVIPLVKITVFGLDRAKVEIANDSLAPSLNVFSSASLPLESERILRAGRES